MASEDHPLQPPASYAYIKLLALLCTWWYIAMCNITPCCVAQVVVWFATQFLRNMRLKLYGTCFVVCRCSRRWTRSPTLQMASAGRTLALLSANLQTLSGEHLLLMLVGVARIVRIVSLFLQHFQFQDLKHQGHKQQSLFLSISPFLRINFFYYNYCLLRP